MAMEATIFTGWIYDHLLPHAAAVKVHIRWFGSIKQAISYCGRCSAEKSSADKVMRMPISQRKKHIQQVLVEATPLAPRYNQELALLYKRERQRGNSNRATLAVARKLVTFVLAAE